MGPRVALFFSLEFLRVFYLWFIVFFIKLGNASAVVFLDSLPFALGQLLWLARASVLFGIIPQATVTAHLTEALPSCFLSIVSRVAVFYSFYSLQAMLLCPPQHLICRRPAQWGSCFTFRFLPLCSWRPSPSFERVFPVAAVCLPPSLLPLTAPRSLSSGADCRAACGSSLALTCVWTCPPRAPGLRFLTIIALCGLPLVF